MRVGIAGSAAVEGLTETPGIVTTETHPVVKRAAIIWLIVFGALMFFHVGGSKL